MIDASLSFCDKFCLTFNVKKSKVVVFGKPHNVVNLCPLTIDSKAIDYVAECHYLGVTLKGGIHFGFTARPDQTSFFRATRVCSR